MGMNGIGVAGAVVAGVMVADAVQARVEAGRTVHPIVRAYFGRGNGCATLCLWGLTVMVIAFFASMISVRL